MHISINERLRPFDQLPGTMCPLPGSKWCVQVFPSLIRIYDLSCKDLVLLARVTTDIQGPVTNFTVQLDLEKGFLHVWGNSLNGYFRYKIFASSDALKLQIENEKDTHPISFNSSSDLLSTELKAYEIGFCDRLSLGIHKCQDWTLMKRRLDLKEIFPIWLKLGQLMLPVNEDIREGTASLLTKCEEAINEEKKTELLNHFQNLFLVGFQSFMTPTLVDHQYQGFSIPETYTTSSPLVILSYGAKLIRSLFVTLQDSILKILPALPVQFHSGRFLHVKLKNLGLLDLEWSKKTVRRMIINADFDRKIQLKLPKEIKRYRFKEEDEVARVLEANCNLDLKKGKVYFFDRFEK